MESLLGFLLLYIIVIVIFVDQFRHLHRPHLLMPLTHILFNLTLKLTQPPPPLIILSHLHLHKFLFLHLLDKLLIFNTLLLNKLYKLFDQLELFDVAVAGGVVFLFV